MLKEINRKQMALKSVFIDERLIPFIPLLHDTEPLQSSLSPIKITSEINNS